MNSLKTQLFLETEFLIIDALFTFPDVWKSPRGGFVHAEFDFVAKIANSFNQRRKIENKNSKKYVLNPNIGLYRYTDRFTDNRFSLFSF